MGHDHPQFTGVTPAPGCPHYITLRDAELGKIICPWCEEQPITPRKKRIRRPAEQRTVTVDGEAA